MHTGLRTKYRYYQVGAVAVYSANYLDPVAEAAWFEADEGYVGYELANDEAESELGVTEVPAAEGQMALDTVYEPEPEVEAPAEAEAEVAVTQPEMPVMEIKQPVQMISKDMPVRDPSLPNLPPLQERRRSSALRVPKRHKQFNTLITRN